MKTSLNLAGALLLALSVVTVRAVPTLQLDIGSGTGGSFVSNGVYDPIGETTVATTPTFTLRALLNTDGTPPLTTDFTVVATVMQDGAPATDLTTPTFGPVQLGSIVYTSADFTVGDNPNLPGNQPAFWLALPSFNFAAGDTTGSYDVATGAAAGGTLYYHDFYVDARWLLEHFGAGADDIVIPLNDLYDLQFDIYGGDIRGGKATWVNPGSHDASTWYSVPDGGTTSMLVGLGILGLAIVSRRRK